MSASQSSLCNFFLVAFVPSSEEDCDNIQNWDIVIPILHSTYTHYSHVQAYSNAHGMGDRCTLSFDSRFWMVYSLNSL